MLLSSGQQVSCQDPRFNVSIGNDILTMYGSGYIRDAPELLCCGARSQDQLLVHNLPTTVLYFDALNHVELVTSLSEVD